MSEPIEPRRRSIGRQVAARAHRLHRDPDPAVRAGQPAPAVDGGVAAPSASAPARASRRGEHPGRSRRLGRRPPARARRMHRRRARRRPPRRPRVRRGRSPVGIAVGRSCPRRGRRHRRLRPVAATARRRPSSTASPGPSSPPATMPIPDGTLEQFRDCYGPTWGRFLDAHPTGRRQPRLGQGRTWPAISATSAPPPPRPA